MPGFRKPKRVLYLPSEQNDARQRGPRQALGQLVRAGHIQDAKVFSYLWRLCSPDYSDPFPDLQRLLRKYKPHIVLTQHPAKTGLGHDEWRALRSSADFTMVYHEADAYDRLRKRVPLEMRAAARASDVAFSVGASAQQDLLRRAGARDVRWCPSTYNPNDFGSMEMVTDKTYDVVMIGNHSPSRMPFMSMPGCAERFRLQETLARRYGDRFALFGSGWNREYGSGPVPYLDQEKVVQSAHISVNWDHYSSEAMFFSDRLPIALASGTVHVTSAHPGYESLFGSELGFLHYERSVEAVVARVETLLSDVTSEGFLERARASRRYADAHFRQDENLVTLLNAGGADIDPAEARACWDASAPALEEM